ncbi:MAG: endo-1,4-beta-xylanase [Kiritimatiellae bacterium]|nr:endo-1,4-beta-xylanase [Kiritimatiellia bacterium]
MKIHAIVLSVFAVAVSGHAADPVLKDAFGGRFSLGAAISAPVWTGDASRDRNTLLRHFNSITAENEMKPCALQPEEGSFDWSVSDRFVEFGEKNGMKIVGHCLVWHNQTPGWFFKGGDGKDADRETLINRMRSHIHAVVGRYKGRVYGWDVVNEAFGDDGKLHDSPWLRIVGPDFVELAFRFAHEADPSAELYYNDFGMAGEKKRRAVVNMVRDFRAKGIRIDGIGMQTHVNLADPDVKEWEKSLEAFASEGVKVMVTEMDVSVLPSAWDLSAEITGFRKYDPKFDPWRESLPAGMEERLAKRYGEFFKVLLSHSASVDRVTLWGVEDGSSWLNGFPMRGRTDYPLFFGRDGRMKLCARRVASLEVPEAPAHSP